MLPSNNETSQFNIREYAIEGLHNRHRFESPSFQSTLIGKAQTFQSVFLHSDKIVKHLEDQLAETGKRSIAGYSDKVAVDNIPIDVDSKENLKLGQDVTIQILYSLRDNYGLDPTLIDINFSGNKGFHLQIPGALFGGFTPSKELPGIVKSIVEELVGDLGRLVDFSIYGHTRIIRIENTQHEKTNLFSIPLSLHELETMTIDEIRALATTVRTRDAETPRSLASNQSLVDLRRRIETKNVVQPVIKSDENKSYSYTSLKIDSWGKIPKHCKVLGSVEEKSKKKENIGHEERFALGCVATAFGEDGKKKVHELLKDQHNYDREKTASYLDSMTESAYKPKLCEHICGPDKLCDAIKAINRRSPIAFAYTYDPDKDHAKRYVESYAVEKVVNHFENLLYVTTEKLFYEYRSGIYQLIDEEQLKSRICQFLPYYFPLHDVTNNRLNSLLSRVKLERTIRCEDRLNENMFQINLQNGIYDMRTAKMTAHDMKNRSSVQLPFAYNQHATCPLFDKFMDETFKGDAETIDYVLKLWCYLLLPTYAFQKIWVWLGEGRNGKGVLSRLMIRMLGEKNVSHEDIHQLAHERFSTINLKDKLANISTELRADDLDMAQIKKLSGEDYISAEYKGKDKINFKSCARLLVIANQLPRFSEIGTAILERFEFIRFENVLRDNAVDTTLEEKLAKELPGIFNRVVSKYADIVGTDGRIYFAESQRIRTTKSRVLSDLSSVVEFVESECNKGPKLQIPLKNLYQAYTDWSKDAGYKPFGRNKFADVLRKACKLTVINGGHNQMVVLGLSK